MESGITTSADLALRVGRISSSHEVLARLRPWLRLGAGFAAGQMTTQLLNVVVGFVLLRWLTTEAYAQFSFAFGFQAMLGMCLDLGAAGAITALVGARTGDPAVIGSYVAAAKALRLRLALIVLPIGTTGFFLAGNRHGWPLLTNGLLLGSVLAAVFAQSNASIYATPLLIRRRLGPWYRVGVMAAAGRLVAFAGLHALGFLNGWITAWGNMLAIAATAIGLRRASHSCVAEPVVAPPAARREMRRYLTPLIPGVIFTAFQGQITVLLITAFGRTDNIAEVAALGRLGQIFLLLAAFNGIVLQPHMAALPKRLVLPRYLVAVCGAMLVGGVICLCGWFWPAPLLWLLGAKYAHLGGELRWLLLASTLNYVGSVMWAIHAARRWIFWWGSAVYIGGTLAIQGLAAATLNLSQTRDVILFSVWTAMASLVVHLATAVYGFMRPPAEGSA